jgi:hypothetical protein
LKNQQFLNGDMSSEFADVSCADVSPDDSAEESSYATASEEGDDLVGPFKPDVDVVQSAAYGGGSAEPDNNTVRYGDKPGKLDSDLLPAVQSVEGLAERESGSILVNDTPGKTKVLNGVDEIGLLGSEENVRLQGCAENGVHHLTGPQSASTDAVMGSATN